MADARSAVKAASTLVSEAITTLAAVGPDAPSSVREALTTLGSAFTTLGRIDPSVPYSIPRKPGEPGGDYH